MTYHARQDETAEWLNYLQPEGLVVGANVLREQGLSPIRQTPLDTEEAARGAWPRSGGAARGRSAFRASRRLAFLRTRAWLAGEATSPAQPGRPRSRSAALIVTVPEHETLLVARHGGALERTRRRRACPPRRSSCCSRRSIPTAATSSQPGEWEASPHQRLERLLRETNVGVGVLVARNTLRLVYAPRGETAGWLSWPLAALGRVEGRPMLAGLKLCLGRNAFFTGAPETRLRALLEASREAQNAVSEKLSGQVLGALLRTAARPASRRARTRSRRSPSAMRIISMRACSPA